MADDAAPEDLGPGKELVRELTDAEFEVLRRRAEVREQAKSEAQAAIEKANEAQAALQDIVAAFAGGYDDAVEVEYHDEGARIVRRLDPDEKVEEAAERAAALVDGELTEETEEED